MAGEAADLWERLDARARALLVEGCARFDAGAFFEAHERWEDAWRDASGDARVLLQGAIQAAAAFHKGLVQRRPAGMVRLLGAALAKLEAGGGPARLALADVRDELRGWRTAAARWAEDGVAPDRPLPRFGPTR